MLMNKAVLLLITGLMSTAAYAEGKDILWEVTSKMEMAGMPMAIPAQTQKVCAPEGKGDESKIPPDKNCRLLESKQSGNKLTFKMVCEQDGGKMTGNGEIISSPDSYRGTLHIRGKSEGHDVDMTSNFTGKKLGNCSAGEQHNKAAAMNKQSDGHLTQMCDEYMKSLTIDMFFGVDATCKDRQAEYCKQVAQTTRTAKGYEEYGNFNQAAEDYAKARGTTSNRFKLCKLDEAALLKDACKDGIGTEDWNFVSEFCPSDAIALRQKICTGRAYTAMSEQSQKLCSEGGKGANSASGRNNDNRKQDAVSEGIDKLKGMFNF